MFIYYKCDIKIFITNVEIMLQAPLLWSFILFQVCILVYLFFTGNNYPDYTSNFEGRFLKIVVKKIMFGHIYVLITVKVYSKELSSQMSLLSTYDKLVSK